MYALHMAIYQRHTPETTVLYQTIARVWPSLRAEYAASDAPFAEHVETEFERYLRCGILQYGFVRLKCDSCSRTKLVGFSCKKRGFCASCGARRMEQTADRLEREVWPVANARQFVLTFPHQVRRWLAASPELLSEVVLVVTDVIKEFYEDSTLRESDREMATMPTTGTITFIQRFASSLAVNPHLHIVALDGVFAQTAKGKRFYAYDRFDSECVLAVLYGIYHRLEALFRARGYVKEDGEGVKDAVDDSVPLPFKPRAPKAYRRLGSRPPHPLYKQTDPEMMSVEGWCNVRWRWFSLHAGVAIKGDDRLGLKRLFRYVSRSSVSPSRLSYNDPDHPETSDVILGLKRMWTDGTTALRFTQVDLVERIAALVPPAWFNLTRYEGLFAPGHAWRATVVPGPQVKRPPRDPDDPPPPSGPSAGRAVAERNIPWAELMRRTMGISPEICICGAKMRVEDVVTDSETICEVMVAMGLASTPPPRGRRRVETGELDYLFED